MSHTPGQWQWTSGGEPIKLAHFKSPGYYDNVELMSTNGQLIIGCGEYDVLTGATPDERIANGKLLAAAPELLETVKVALPLVEALHEVPDRRARRMREILARLQEEE